jgi:putative glutathione S-transferase
MEQPQKIPFTVLLGSPSSYFEANSEYDGRYTVPVLWDKNLETMISNESSDVIRMLYEELDALLPKERTESQ